MNRIIKVVIISTFLIITNNAYSQEVKDFFNRNIKISNKITKIISLTPATTEIMYAIGAENKLIGVTDDCNYPKQAQEKEKLGKFGFINYEKLILLKPDLLLVTKDMGAVLNGLKKYDFPIIALDTPDIKSILNNIDILGKVTHNEKQANLLSLSLSNTLNKVKEKNLKIKIKKKVFYCIWHDPIMTVGEKSFVGDMISLSGGDNVAKNLKTSFGKYSIESLITKNPEYLIFPESTYKKVNLNLFPWSKLKAVKEKKIIIVNDDRFLRPAPRVFQAIEELQGKLNGIVVKKILKNRKPHLPPNA